MADGTEERGGQQVIDDGRRRIVGAGSLLAALGLMWKPQPSAAQRGRGGSLVLDVACLGDSFAPNFGGVIDQPGGDFRGLSFYVEGALFPGGTIPPGSGFNPGDAMQTGHWLCRGWFMNYPARPAPGAITTQEYLLEVISAEAPSPVDTLVSSGLEGGAMSFTRAVIGGSGNYRHARGAVVQETIGTNTTILNVFGENAPNFRFYFDF